MAQVYDEPIVVRLTVPVGSYPVGTEFGFKDVADAIRALGSSSYFTVVRTQDGDPIPPPTPEDMTEAEKQALARARAARLIRGSEFDALVPGPGEVIVGSEDGPVAVPVDTIGGGGSPVLDAIVVGVTDATHEVTTTGAVTQVDGQHADAWQVEGAAVNALPYPDAPDPLVWGYTNAADSTVADGRITHVVSSSGMNSSVTGLTSDLPGTLFSADDPVTGSVRVQARAGVSLRIRLLSRKADGGSGAILGSTTATATGDWQSMSVLGTYPSSDINGRVGLQMTVTSGADDNEEVFWEQPQVEKGTVATSFIPQMDEGGNPVPGYTNLGSDVSGPYAREAGSITIPVEAPPYLYARYSEDGGTTWSQGVVSGDTIGTTGTLTRGDESLTISTTGTAFLLEGMIGLARPFTASEIEALEAGPLTLATLLSGGGGSPSAPAVTRKFHPATMTFKPFDIGNNFRYVRHVSRGGDIVFSAQGHLLYQTRDEFATQQLVVTGLDDSSISAIRLLDDGEILYSTNRRDDAADMRRTRLFKTSGYDPLAGTVTSVAQVLEADSQYGNFSNVWGLDVCGPICLAMQYGLKGEDGARYAYISEDYGETWRMLFDQKETTVDIPGAPTWSPDTSHMHTIHYDRYQGRIWLAVGDNPSTAVYYSDDLGETWTHVPGSSGPDAVQYTGITSFPDGVVFGSDRSPNGVYAWKRSTGSNPVKIEQVLSINSHPNISHVFQLAFRRWEREGEIALFSATAVSAVQGTYHPVIVGMTSASHVEVLATLTGVTDGPHTTVGPTRNGYVYSHFDGQTQRAIAPFVSEM